MLAPRPDDLEVVVEDRVRIAVSDDDPGGVEALLLEDAELGQANRGHDRMGGDRTAGALRGAGGGTMDPFLGR